MELKFCEMNFEEDKTEIFDWQNRFAGTAGWDNIFKFVLERGLIHDLSELIETNYEIAKIGDDERKLALSIKDKTDEIVAFVICQEFEMKTDSPELFIQYVVVRPDKQRQGIGRKIYHRLPDAVEKMTGKRPTRGFAVVSMQNNGSLKLFEELGFAPSSHYAEFLQMRGSFERHKEKE